MAPKNLAFRRAFNAAFVQVRQYSAPGDRSIPAAKQKYVPTSGTYPKGFLAGTAHAGVKASNTKYDDVTMVVSEQPCSATAVFTRNVFKAAPVTVSKQTLRERSNQGFRGVIVNSGCANAVTGKKGAEDAATMGRETDKCFGEVRTGLGDLQDPPQTLVMSTGVIGQQLPIDKITGAIPKAHQALGNSHEHWLKAAQAICTTDTFPKLISRTFTLLSHPETEYRIAGMTKGAGMIHPNMATLLGIICTDAKISPSTIDEMLRVATRSTFNSITIDGDTSTNDTVALFANGAAAPGAQPAIEYDARSPHTASQDAQAFLAVLETFMRDLAQLVVRDGEGATKFVTVRVQSDISFRTAKRAATSIATSSLVKTALYGKDANWGRILCAIGYAPGIIPSVELPLSRNTTDMDGSMYQVGPERTSVSFVPADGSPELKLLVRGEPEQVDEARAKEILEMEDLEILVRLDDGPLTTAQVRDLDRRAVQSNAKGRSDEKLATAGRKQHEAVVWTCDFSHEYVTINGDYRT
ncbi:arginine biosynthesis bifunctional protein ArgJ beta chain [Hortaea werneckii]|nr:arginine biosynthesis bifunctional protein ArgJ beta chain [Hortaea werneckii]KAI7069527.1 arginine biosynthesis bifunctional protein ArgJ beta chain [Hortaea werneckii]KAI7220415.1 arginine biosynthesis bifunctional protein ArgJ beta chain [Hortaea werneckii]KAI7298507.1 arginine biosynthesis bifunctional protein ArgJ beta chain [Hortaea werneckii]